MSETPTANPVMRTLGPLVAGFLVLVVLATYGFDLAHGRWPPGHPWSGLTLLGLAVAQALTRADTTDARSPVRLVAIGLALLGSLLWVASAAIAASR